MIRRLGSPFLDYTDRSAIALGLSVAIALLAIPVCRAVNRAYFGQQQRSLRVLSEAVTTKVRLAIAEDQGRTGHG